MIEYIALTNFLSFRERTVFSMKATKEKPRGTLTSKDWWTEIDGIKLLKAAFLLGNNGSGKTNFLNSLSVLNELITTSKDSKTAARYRLPDVTFKLAEETKNAASEIEVAFHTAGYRYMYHIAWTTDHITEEQLSKQEGKRKEKVIYLRTFSDEKDIVEVTYPKDTTITGPVQELINQNILKNASVISIYDNKNFECEDIRIVFEYFRYSNLWNVNKYELASMLASRSNENLLKPILLNMLKAMGSTICDYKVDTYTFDISDDEREFLLTKMSEEQYRSRFPDDKRTVKKLMFGYKIVGKEETQWLPENLESEGTLDAIRLVIVLFDCIWRRTPIAIDECAQSIHPKALEYIFSFFLKSADTAQVLFASQAMMLLKWNNLRRDTLRFFKKDKSTGNSSFTTINNRTLHRNNQIYDLYMSRTFDGDELDIKENLVNDEILNKVSVCMKNREWND